VTRERLSPEAVPLAQFGVEIGSGAKSVNSKDLAVDSIVGSDCGIRAESEAPKPWRISELLHSVAWAGPERLKEKAVNRVQEFLPNLRRQLAELIFRSLTEDVPFGHGLTALALELRVEPLDRSRRDIATTSPPSF
jgi:hypothetical protein